jgi:hypothetical protein
MNTNVKDTVFKEVVNEALKKMQKTVTSVSSSYQVVRSSGELIIQRTGENSNDHSQAQTEKVN